MFEQASRMKLRFSYKGSATAEDLWDIPLEDLDKMYQELTAAKDAAGGESLLHKRSAGDAKLELQIALVRHVVETRLAEKAERDGAAERAAKRREVLDIIADKKAEELRNKPVKELEKMARALE